VIDENGEEWLPAAVAADRVRLPRYRVDQWVNRGLVRQHRIGGRSWVNYPDVAKREHAWRTRSRAPRVDA
jgi:hypothetical protein